MKAKTGNRIRKFLAILLTLTMVFSMCSFNAFASSYSDTAVSPTSLRYTNAFYEDGFHVNSWYGGNFTAPSYERKYTAILGAKGLERDGNSPATQVTFRIFSTAGGGEKVYDTVPADGKSHAYTFTTNYAGPYVIQILASGSYTYVVNVYY